MPRENMPEQHNGHRRASRRGNEHDWQATARDALGRLSKMDVPDVIRKNPYPALAVAGAAGLLIGITVGSRLVRMIVGSIGMYALSELGKRYASQAFENMEFYGEEEPVIETD
jgi:hypothetical protein